ncbi:MAG: T9SS type A sorting domain-containing protein [Candidatus Delongbacteria bacterium]
MNDDLTVEDCKLYQNYPNPFNSMTQIKFALAKTADVKLSVYNISAQVVSQLARGTMNAGHNAVDFDGSKLNSGIYFYTLEVDGKTMTKKMVLTK